MQNSSKKEKIPRALGDVPKETRNGVDIVLFQVSYTML